MLRQPVTVPGAAATVAPGKAVALCPVAPGWHGLQRAVAVERLGNGRQSLRDGSGAFGGGPPACGATHGGDDGARVPHPTAGAGLGRRERRRCGLAQAEAAPWLAA